MITSVLLVLILVSGSVQFFMNIYNRILTTNEVFALLYNEISVILHGMQLVCN